MSHSRTEWSAPPETSWCSERGDQQTAHAGARWPLSWCVATPATGSHSSTSEPAPAAATSVCCVETGDMATAATRPGSSNSQATLSSFVSQSLTRWSAPPVTKRPVSCGNHSTLDTEYRWASACAPRWTDASGCTTSGVRGGSAGRSRTSYSAMLASAAAESRYRSSIRSSESDVTACECTLCSSIAVAISTARPRSSNARVSRPRNPRSRRRMLLSIARTSAALTGAR